MEIFYVDGQSLGNEQRSSSRRAKIVFVHQWSANPDQSRVYWKDVGDKTNSEAEYLALLEALSFVSRNLDQKDGATPDTVEIRSDSQFMVKQIHGEYKVKEERLRPIWDQARNIIAQLGFVRVKWVSREENYAGHWLEGKWAAKAVVRL